VRPDKSWVDWYSELRFSLFTNDIAGEILNLREFLLADPDSRLTTPTNQVFFRKWANNPTMSLIAETRASGFWTKEKIEELHRDLDQLDL